MHASSVRRGFTLIELLVVIAIISLLSSIVYSNLALARTKAIDTRKRADLTSVRTALNSFYSDTGRMPHMYDCSGPSCVTNDNRATIEVQDPNNPGSPTSESGLAYNATMQELVAAHFLSAVPYSPGGPGYTYYDYGPNSSAGAVVGTSLNSVDPSTTGLPGSCRPFPSQGPVAFLDTVIEKIKELTTTPAYAFMLNINPGALNCLYLNQNGVLVEGLCPLGAHNLCSADSSKDFCLCSPH